MDLSVMNLPNHFLFGATLATSPETAEFWKGAGFTIFPCLFLKNKILKNYIRQLLHIFKQEIVCMNQKLLTKANWLSFKDLMTVIASSYSYSS